MQLNLGDADAVRRRLSRDRGGGARARRRRAFPGRDRPADGQARRLRADRRQQPRPAVRPGAAVRHRRAAGRGLQGPRAGPAAAEHHAGPADDGADPDLRRRCRASAAGSRSTWRRWSSCWSASASSSSSSRWIKEIDINPLLASPERTRRARRPRGRARRGRRRGPAAPACDPPLSRPSTSAPWTMKDGTAVTIRPIRPEDEPLMVRFHETLSEQQRLPPLLPRDEAEPARRPRAADADLLHRLRPRDGAGGRPPGPGRRRARDPRRRPPEQAAAAGTRPSSPSWSATGTRAGAWARSSCAG